MRVGGVVVGHSLTPVVEEPRLQGQAVCSDGPSALVVVEGGLLHRRRIVEEVRGTVAIIVVVEVHAAIAVGVLGAGRIIAGDVLDKEDIVVVVVVHPRVVLDDDIGVRDHVAVGVLGHVHPDQVTVVLVPVEVGPRDTDGIDGVLVEVGIGIGPGDVSRTIGDLGIEAEGIVTIQGRHRQVVAVIQGTRQQGLTVGLVMGDDLVDVAAVDVVDEQPGDVTLAMVGRQLGDGDRRGPVGALEVRRQNLVAVGLHQAALVHLSLGHVGGVAEGVDDLLHRRLLAALGLVLADAGQFDHLLGLVGVA